MSDQLRDMNSAGGGWRNSFWLGLLAVTVATFLCIGAATIALNDACESAFANNMPVYPGAEVTFEQRGFLQTKVIELYTPDSPAAVNNWFAGFVGRTTRADIESGSRFGTAWRGDYQITPANDRPAGSYILLTYNCP